MVSVFSSSPYKYNGALTKISKNTVSPLPGSSRGQECQNNSKHVRMSILTCQPACVGCDMRRLQRSRENR